MKFTAISSNCTLSISLPLNMKNEKLISHLIKQPREFKMTMLNLAFCRWFGENTLIIGETSHKSTVVTDYFAKLIKFSQVPEPLTTIYLSNMTEVSDILGAM